MTAPLLCRVQLCPPPLHRKCQLQAGTVCPCATRLRPAQLISHCSLRTQATQLRAQLSDARFELGRLHAELAANDRVLAEAEAALVALAAERDALAAHASPRRGPHSPAAAAGPGAAAGAGAAGAGAGAGPSSSPPGRYAPRSSEASSTLSGTLRAGGGSQMDASEGYAEDSMGGADGGAGAGADALALGKANGPFAGGGVQAGAGAAQRGAAVALGARTLVGQSSSR
jgi:hypothetical protein